MDSKLLPSPPDGSELARWINTRGDFESTHSNTISIFSPDEEYVLSVEVDDPVQGYLVELRAADPDRETPFGRAIVDDQEVALKVATNMVARARDLEGLTDRPSRHHDWVRKPEGRKNGSTTPDEWESDEWEDALDEAFEKAEIPQSKGTLTTKTIDGRDYYYLQWREGDSVTSQYIAPVIPSSRGNDE